MEWPAPPPGEIVLPETLETEEADDEVCMCLASTSARMCAVLLVWTSSGAVVLRRRVPEGYAHRPGRKTAELHCRHGGHVAARHHLGTPVRQLRDMTFGSMSPRVCPSLCQGHRRTTIVTRRELPKSDHAPNNAFRRDEDRRLNSICRHSTKSRERLVGENGRLLINQLRVSSAVRPRHHRSTGQAQARTILGHRDERA